MYKPYVYVCMKRGCTNVCGLLRVYAPASGMCIRVRLACRCCSHASILEQSIHQQRVRRGGGAGQHPVNTIGHVGDVAPVNRMFHLSVSSGNPMHRMRRACV